MDFQYLQNILQAQEALASGLSSAPLALAQLQPLDLAWKLQNNIQQQYLKAHILQLVNLKNQLLQQTLNKITIPSPTKFPLAQPQPLFMKSLSQDSTDFGSTVSLPDLLHQRSSSTMFQGEKPKMAQAKEVKIPKLEASKSHVISTKLENSEQDFASNELRNQLRKMLLFLIHNFGKASEESIQAERPKYESDKQLLQVFDILVKKYSGASKSREEMIKYVLRKALKAVRGILQKRLNVDYKEASSILCKRYFKGDGAPEEEVSLDLKGGKRLSSRNSEDDDEDGEDILKAMLPFRKNSKNKTMNSNFINEIFSSEEFCKDYEIYLTQIDDILEKDNNRKIEMFLNYLEQRIKKGQIDTIRSCKRMPWINLWIDSTKNVAFELATTKAWIETRKKVNS